MLALESGEITGAAAKDVFAEMVDHGGDPRQIIAERGLGPGQRRSGHRRGWSRPCWTPTPTKWSEYRAGKTGLWGFFVGQVVRSSDGRANPQVVQRVLGDRLR